MAEFYDEDSPDRTRREEERKRSWEQVLDTAAGRHVLADILDWTGGEAGSFTGDTAIFFNEGRRAIGLQLGQEVQAVGFEVWIKLLQERHQRAYDP